MKCKVKKNFFWFYFTMKYSYRALTKRSAKNHYRQVSRLTLIRLISIQLSSSLTFVLSRQYSNVDFSKGSIQLYFMTTISTLLYNCLIFWYMYIAVEFRLDWYNLSWKPQNIKVVLTGIQHNLCNFRWDFYAWGRIHIKLTHSSTPNNQHPWLAVCSRKTCVCSFLAN